MPQQDDWVSDYSSVNDWVSDYTQPEQPGFFGGLWDLPAEMWGGVEKAGREGSKYFMEGNYPAAFGAVTEFARMPFEGLMNIARNKVEGRSALGMSPEEAKSEVKSQIAGVAGLPSESFKEAWETSNYPRLVGQGVTAAALLGAGVAGHRASKRFKVSVERNKPFEPVGDMGDLVQPELPFTDRGYLQQDLPFVEEPYKYANWKRRIGPPYGIKQPELPFGIEPESGQGTLFDSTPVDPYAPPPPREARPTPPQGGTSIPTSEIPSSPEAPPTSLTSGTSIPRTAGTGGVLVDSFELSNAQATPKLINEMMKTGYKVIPGENKTLFQKFLSGEEGSYDPEWIRKARERLARGERPDRLRPMGEEEIPNLAFQPDEGVATTREWSENFIPEAEGGRGRNVFNPGTRAELERETQLAPVGRMNEIAASYPDIYNEAVAIFQETSPKRIVQNLRDYSARYEEVYSRWAEAQNDKLKHNIPVPPELNDAYNRLFRLKDLAQAKYERASVRQLEGRPEGIHKRIGEFFSEEEGSFNWEELKENLRRLLGREPTVEEIQTADWRQPKPGEPTGRVAPFERPNTELAKSLQDEYNRLIKLADVFPEGPEMEVIREQLREIENTIDPTTSEPYIDSPYPGREAQQYTPPALEPANLARTYRAMMNPIIRGGYTPTRENLNSLLEILRHFEANPDQAREFLGYEPGDIDSELNYIHFLLRESEPPPPPIVGPRRLEERRPMSEAELIDYYNEEAPQQQELPLGPRALPPALDPYGLPIGSERTPVDLTAVEAKLRETGRRLGHEPIPAEAPIPEQLPLKLGSEPGWISDFIKNEEGYFDWDAIKKTTGWGQGIQPPKARAVKGQPAPKEPWTITRIYDEVNMLTSNATTTADVSFPGRQGIPLLFTRHSIPAIGRMLASAYEPWARAMDAKLRARPLFQRPIDPLTGKEGPSFADKIGMKLFNPAHMPGPHAQMIASRWLETGGSIPYASAFYRETVGHIPRISNRMALTFLNELNANRTQFLLDRARDMSVSALQGNRVREGILPLWMKKTAQEAAEMNPYTNLLRGKEIADFVNTATGHAPLRTHLLPFKGAEVNLEWASTALNRIYFSPGLFARNIRMLNPSTYVMATPFVRQQYMKAAISQALAWYAFTEMAKMAAGPDAQVNNDITSSDFGKVRIGNARLDAGASALQFLVAFGRAYAGGSTPTTAEAKFRQFGEGFKADTAKDLLENFTVNKFRPINKFVYDLLDATQYKPFHVKDRIAQLFIPMAQGDLWELYNKEPQLLPWMGPAAIGGLSTQIYDRGQEEPLYINPENDKIIEGFALRDFMPWNWGGDETGPGY